MTIHDWHVPGEQLAGYRHGTLAGAAAASVEAHLLACERCRATFASAGEPAHQARQDRIWAGITDHVDRPSRRRFAGHGWARLTIGTPTLQLVTAALVLAILVPPLAAATDSGRAAWVILFVLAPLAPLAAAVAAFRPELDPAGGLTGATPLASFRLVLLRTLVVLAAAVPVGLLASVLLAARLSLLLGWLLPGLALCSIVLVAGTRVEPTRLAVGLAVAWAATVLAAGVGVRRLPATDALEAVFVTHPATQQLSAAVVVAAALILLVRRDALTPWSTS